MLLRLSCHNLEIETGRHKGIDREHRKCPFGCNKLDDEYHFLMVCDKFKELRFQYIFLQNMSIIQIYTNSIC